MEEIESKAIFGQRLKRFREESGYTQSILANILGVERSTYTYYETGKTTPVIFDLMRLCRLYRISLDELCGYSANSADTMRLSDSGQRVKVYARRKERRYLADSVLDLSTVSSSFWRIIVPLPRKIVRSFLNICAMHGTVTAATQTQNNLQKFHMRL